MSQSLPMKPGIGYPPDGPVELERKIVWNLYAIYQAMTGGGSGSAVVRVDVPANSSSPGAANQVAWDDEYAYYYTVGSGWRRTPISDWA